MIFAQERATILMNSAPEQIERGAAYNLVGRKTKDSLGAIVASLNGTKRVLEHDPFAQRGDQRSIAYFCLSYDIERIIHLRGL